MEPASTDATQQAPDLTQPTKDPLWEWWTQHDMHDTLIFIVVILSIVTVFLTVQRNNKPPPNRPDNPRYYQLQHQHH